MLNYLESVFTEILEITPRFIVSDLTRAADIPGMEHLVPLGEKSLARAFDDAVSAAREPLEATAA